MRTGRAYMSIGEVLNVLKPEFPDVSVSKIRFLEGEGLIEPERTPSGYRKFTQRDLDRLRFVLKLQRDSYLPLRVIRERLAAADAGVATAEGIATPAAAPVLHVQAPAPAATPANGNGSGIVAPPRASDAEDDVLSVVKDVRLTENDLAGATGLDITQTRALREYGVICEHTDGAVTYFDGDDLAVAKIARDFLKLGVEARHLKSLRRFAEQEASLFEQLVAPGLRHRRPEAREQATQTLRELARLSRHLRSAYVRQALRGTVSGDR